MSLAPIWKGFVLLFIGGCMNISKADVEELFFNFELVHYVIFYLKTYCKLSSYFPHNKASAEFMLGTMTTIVETEVYLK